MSRQEDTSNDAALVERTYQQLRRIARGYFSRQPVGHTLQPTALVHEAFVKMARTDASAFEDETHFVSVAARAMRQILVDHARKRGAAKRGGGAHRVTLSGVPGVGGDLVDVLTLDRAIEQLTAASERQARVVELKFFGGLSMPEIARATKASVATVERDWRSARAWLMMELANGEQEGR